MFIGDNNSFKRSLLDEAVALTQGERGEQHEEQREGEATDIKVDDVEFISDAQVAQHLEMLWAQEQTLHIGQLRCLRRAGKQSRLLLLYCIRISRLENILKTS